MAAYWRQEQPLFQIDRQHSLDSQPYPCCSVNGYRVRSMRKLTREALQGLFKLGLLGSGQEFRIHGIVDGNETPAGHYVAPCVDEKTGLPAKNPVTGLGYPDHKYPYYDYLTSTLCDSSD